MKVFVIDAFNDGHLAVTTLTSVDGGGSSHDRKKRARLEANGKAPERKWSRADRKIFRNGVTEPVQIAPGIELLPFGSEDSTDSAMENDAVTDAYVDFTLATTSEIDHHIADFKVQKPKVVQNVKLIYTDGSSIIL